jgi:hypothetical protein
MVEPHGSNAVVSRGGVKGQPADRSQRLRSYRPDASRAVLLCGAGKHLDRGQHQTRKSADRKTLAIVGAGRDLAGSARGE